MSQPSTGAPQTFFSRKATGLVREMSVRDAAIFNVLPAVPGAVIAYFLLWGLSAFPGADLILDMIIVGVFSTLLALAFGLLSVAMPRSGADYILNSRTLHPALGLAGSVTLMISGLLSIGYWSLWTIQGGVGPTLIQIGASLNNNSTLQSWGSTLSASNAPTFILALALVLATTWALLSGLRLVMRIQLWLFVVAMGGFILTIILLLFTSHDAFVSGFNTWAKQYTNQSDSYTYFLQAAAKNGYTFNGQHDWKMTLFATGVVMSTGIWAWFSVNLAGEVKQGNTLKHVGAILIGQAITYVSLLVMTILLYNIITETFLGALNNLNGTPAYTLPAPPYYVMLVSLIWNNPILAAVLGISFLAWFPLVVYIQWIQPIRAMFAYAFDGVFPMWIARVSDRFHTPINATILTTLIGIGCLVWATFLSKSFFALLALAAIVGFPAMLLVGISALIFPWRRPELFRTSAAGVKWLGVPIVSVVGVGAMITAVWGFYDYLTQPGLLANPQGAAWVTFGTFALAFVYYFIARGVRMRQGINLDLNFAVVPPE
jgi:basic amino acid/polyamine antiporter, APA family